MELLVNNKLEQLPASDKLYQLLLQLGIADKRGIAVAVNNAVIARAEWDNYKLNDKDKITIIRPTQGG